MPVIHPDKVIIAVPQHAIDQVVQIITGSFAVTAGITDAFNQVTAGTGAAEIDLSVLDTFLYKGLYSIDGGVSWQDLGNEVILGDYANGLRTFSLSTSLSYDNTAPHRTAIFLNATNSGNSAYTCQYKILLMARPDQDNVPSSLLTSSQALRYDSNNNYMKVHMQGSVVLNSGGTTSINHGLGYMPNVNVWIQSHIYFAPDDFTMMTEGSQNIKINTSDLILPARSSSPAFIEVKAYYRIYLDS